MKKTNLLICAIATLSIGLKAMNGNNNSQKKITEYFPTQARHNHENNLPVIPQPDLVALAAPYHLNEEANRNPQIFILEVEGNFNRLRQHLFEESDSDELE